MRFFKLYIAIFFVTQFSHLSFARIKTPLEESGFKKLTTHTEMIPYLKKLDKKCAFMQMEFIGESVKGKSIPVLYFSDSRKFRADEEAKPLVLIYCQQHGNEPSGKEAGLELTSVLADGKRNRFDNFDLILIPMMNPDGADSGERRNANKMDLNRDHAALTQPETIALHKLFLKWKPEITLDVHEYNAVSKSWVEKGIIKNADEMLGGVTNLNIDSRISGFSRETFMPEFGKSVGEKGYTFHRYVVGFPFDGGRMRYSTTAINDSRQSMGIYNTFSFILEGKKYGDNENYIERRTSGQLAALESFLEMVDLYGRQMLDLVKQARQEIITGTAGKLAAVQMDYYPDPANDKIIYPVFDLYEWAPAEKELENFHAVVKPKKSVTKPEAYVFSAEMLGLIELFRRHGIKMHRLAGKSDLPLEVYQIINLTEQIEEELTAPNVDAAAERSVRRLEKGTIIVYLNQPAGNLLPLLLEPQSTHNLTTEHSGQSIRFDNWVIPGEEYPIYRLMEKVEIGLEEMERPE